jgi:membrane protease YdiL (CAAX protease family)
MLMVNQSKWGGAKLALISYLVLFGGMGMASFIVWLLLSGMGTTDLSFPIGLISLPVASVTILGITLLFARYKDAGSKELGLRKISLRILAIVVITALLTPMLQMGIIIGEEAILGPDPMAENFQKMLIPKNSLQLVAMIAISLVVVGPSEELAFRGFIQKGFENSLWNNGGLLIASLLFTIIHVGWGLYSVVSVFPVALVFGYVWQRTKMK